MRKLAQSSHTYLKQYRSVLEKGAEQLSEIRQTTIAWRSFATKEKKAKEPELSDEKFSVKIHPYKVGTIWSCTFCAALNSVEFQCQKLFWTPTAYSLPLLISFHSDRFYALQKQHKMARLVYRPCLDLEA